MAHWIWFILLLSVLDIFQCCPTGYTLCAVEGNICSLTDTNIIAYGWQSWYYKQITGAFECVNAEIGVDPAVGVGKECCYQNNQIYQIPSNISNVINWSPGTLQCNQVVQGFLAEENETHIWRFTVDNTLSYLSSVTFDNCGSQAYDLQLYLFDNSGTQITGCNECGSCSAQLKSDFTQNSLTTGTYWLQILPFDNPATIDAGNYDISVTCPGYGGVLTCSENSISGSTTSSNPYAYFSVVTKSKKNIQINSCGSSYDTKLFIYSDSEFLTQLTGGDNDACSSGEQEIYTLSGTDPGTVYVRLDRYSTSEYGRYTVSIICSGTFPTAPPTPSPTNKTPSPTLSPTKNPTSSPTFLPTNPTSEPTVNPTNPTDHPSRNPSVDPTKQPTVNPTNQPTQQPTLIPILSPTMTSKPTGKQLEIITNPTSTPTMDSTSQLTMLSNDSVDGQLNNKNQDDGNILIISGCILVGVLCLVLICIIYIIRRKKSKKNIVMKDLPSVSVIYSTSVQQFAIAQQSRSTLEIGQNDNEYYAPGSAKMIEIVIKSADENFNHPDNGIINEIDNIFDNNINQRSDGMDDEDDIMDGITLDSPDTPQCPAIVVNKEGEIEGNT